MDLQRLALPQPIVLVVDDQAEVRHVLHRIVAALGCQVMEASDAEAALAILVAHDVQMALCDVQMPGRDGVWLLEQIKHASPTTCVAFITGVTTLDPRVTLQPGVVGYLVKPFDPSEVQRLVRDGLAMRQPLGLPDRREKRLLE